MKKWIRGRIKFIHDFCQAMNAADGSQVDANANVTSKDIAVLEAELPKKDTIETNRALVMEKLTKLFGRETAAEYEKDINSHLIYVHDETSLKPYCASVSLYPFLLEGTKGMGGVSRAPKNLQSFCGSFVNLVYQLASNFAGAIATVEFLLYFDYFARKTYGDCYLLTHQREIEQEFQGVVYGLNQPASARGNQSVFWNISVFDQFYFQELFGEFYFPDGTQADYFSVQCLQTAFMKWFRNERKKELLTFPVITAAMLIDPETKLPRDREFEIICAMNMSLGHSFFIYQSTKADSLASCCRLRNELADNQFSYTLGAGGVSTGSFQVITVNFNRLEQRYSSSMLRRLISRVHRYLAAHRAVYLDYIQAGLIPAYSAGFISLDKQFGTIGINGMLEAYEFKRNIYGHLSYTEYLTQRLHLIKRMNKETYAEYGFRFNTEFVPAENLGVKNAKWDKEDSLFVPRDCYNSYFFPVEDTELTVLDKLKIHGEEVSQYLDGGAACHLNLEQIPTYDNAIRLIRTAAKLGVPYWTFNVLNTICDDCGHIDPATHTTCQQCGSANVGYATRIIGYLKRISNFSTARQQEAERRGYSDVIL